MENKKEFIGVLDLGTTKIVYLLAEKSEEGLSIVDFSEVSSEGMNRGEVINVKETANSIKTAIDAVEKDAKIIVDDIIVGIAGYSIETEIVSENIVIGNREIQASDLEELEDMVKRQMIDERYELVNIFLKHYVVIDVNNKEFETLDPVGYKAKKLYGNFHLVKIIKSTKNLIEESIRFSGKKVKEYILEPIASAKSTLSDRERELGVVLIDIGGGTSDVALFSKHKLLLTAVNPIGSEVLTDNIKDAFSITYSDAKKLKEENGSCMPSEIPENTYIEITGVGEGHIAKISKKELAKVIRSKVKESMIEPIIGEIEANSIDLSNIKEFVITGGGSMLPGIDMAVEFWVGIKTRIGKVLDKYKLNEEKRMYLQVRKELQKPQYATVIGLLLYAYEHNLTSLLLGEKEDIEIKDEGNKKEKLSAKKDKKKKKNFWGKILDGLGEFVDDGGVS